MNEVQRVAYGAKKETGFGTGIPGVERGLVGTRIGGGTRLAREGLWRGHESGASLAQVFGEARNSEREEQANENAKTAQAAAF